MRYMASLVVSASALLITTSALAPTEATQLAPASSVATRFPQFASDAALEDYVQREHPKDLNLMGSHLTSEGLKKSLRKVPELENLTMAYLQLSGFAVKDIAFLTRLKSLRLEDMPLDDSSLEGIEKFQRLESLDLSGTGLTNSTLSRIARLDNLQCLHLSNCRINDTGLAQLRSLKRLRQLDISGTEAGDATIAMLAETHPDLFKLSVGKRTTDAAFTSLLKMTALTDVAFIDCWVTDRGLSQLAHLENLHTLRLFGGGISDRVFGSLRKLPLCELYCDRLRRTDGGLAALQGLPIRYLRLGSSLFTDSDILVLRQMPELEYLWLDGTEITDASLPLLRSLPNVKQITAGDTNISADGQKELMSLILEKMQELTPEPAATWGQSGMAPQHGVRAHLVISEIPPSDGIPSCPAISR